MEHYDKIIFGAGIYGLYSALTCARQGQRILVLERDSNAFMRATYINQARVHMGYHYPRSKMTALKSAHYFQRFCEDYGFCIKHDFKQIYATSAALSWTNATAFQKFCEDSNIPCERINENEYFRTGLCDGAFLTEEYTYDAMILRDYFLEELKNSGCVDILYNQSNIKYELCEIILCEVDEKLKDIGLTVMDGPFFSIMPFGKTGYHSLTSVTFTPHITSYDETATFGCQRYSNGICTPEHLANCNTCPAKPESAWPYMSQLARKYMLPDLKFTYVKSLFSMKPILKVAEIDDSRPTMIKVEKQNPTFVSAFSGKINTIYDLDEVLLNE